MKYQPRVIQHIKNPNFTHSVKQLLFILDSADTLHKCGRIIADYYGSDDFKRMTVGDFEIRSGVCIKSGRNYLHAVGYTVHNMRPKKEVETDQLLRMFLYVEIPEHASAIWSQGHLRRHFPLPI